MVERLSLEVAGADAVAEALNHAYPMGFVLDDVEARSTFTLRRAQAGPLLMDEAQASARFRFDGGRMDRVMIGMVRRGSVDASTNGLTGRFGPGQCYLPGEPGHHFTGAVTDTCVQVTSLEPALVADTVGHDTDQPLRFHRLRPAAADGDESWRHAVDYALTLLAGDTCPPLLADATARHLAATALTLFPNTYLTASRGLSGPGAVGAASLRRALDFMDDHAHLPVTVGEIAAAAGTTPRAVQYAVRRHTGLTPLGYVRRVRLERAHAELLAADPESGVLVRDVAARWGFAKPGTFSTYYRQVYGRHPSTDLHT
ncbi:AraC family transcriptional regulator [Streptomyces sp. NPDC097619]|uniref:helix-turn-helix transcriptional regulator n=1 Tax=Streptomyces sp. NPDC097619 TaxID=3157228 RepID=UPI00332459A5